MPLYRIHLEDGTDAGEARYSDWLKPGDEIHVDRTANALVVDVVPTIEHDHDPTVVSRHSIRAARRGVRARAALASDHQC